ncbi:DnaA regulatory inactivator Hda [Marinobacter nanhaiticus D15-8W]|uniref:DnaA regulatory inactivator Hda n=1 Tax=Marinobacter nanhaiticus D15-8W TaxID=626887 RepID=N6W2W4_9GAMM|nr:DnaA regulatory inactivator Hda [Marinobacter nanhaiticus]ENO14454.1 DnaA regulatory inactivator Hda [Marinobacter nanhaiticus D15-8W]BES71847.1 DnaA regulatory inactivator Hda [Marinobacter nanhaiticus D15-8W]
MAGNTLEGAQLTLGVRLRDDATFANFLGERNAPAAEKLKALSEDNTLPVIVVCGDSGTGKSHLLQAVCHHSEHRGLSALCLNLGELASLGPQVLQGMEAFERVCLDDIEAVAGNAHWEEALFHLFNRMLDNGHQLILSALEPPARLEIMLGDLASRLQHGVVIQLGLPRDEDRLLILGRRAERRGLFLPEDVSRFILRRAPRHTGELLAILERLDEDSLREQRRLTIPFVKSVMGW